MSEPLFTQQMRDSFPSVAACASATIQPTGTDGNCLFHAFLGATKEFKLALKPTITAADLRNMLLQFLKINRHNKVLPVVSFVNEPLDPSSPEELMNSMKPYRLVPHQERAAVLVPCSCPRPEREHECDGIPAGQLKLHDVTEPIYFKNFDEYLLIMKTNGAYGEDLEIAALSALFAVSICVLVKQPQILSPQSRSRSNILDDNLQIYYHPKSKGTVCLVTFSGRCHYEWLSFANVMQPTKDPIPKDNGIVEIPSDDDGVAIDNPSTPLHEPGGHTADPLQPPPFLDWLDVQIYELVIQDSGSMVVVTRFHQYRF
jgi:hypothetical protein